MDLEREDQMNAITWEGNARGLTPFETWSLRHRPKYLENFVQGCGLTFDFEVGPFLAGGAVRRAVQWDATYHLDTVENEANIPPDFDVFCRNAEQWEGVCRQLLRTGAELTADHNRYANFMIERMGWKIQVVRREFYKNARELLADFDFTICQFATDSRLEILAAQGARADVVAKRLVLNKIEAPPGSIIRLVKFSKQGFEITRDDLVKLMRQTRIEGS